MVVLRLAADTCQYNMPKQRSCTSDPVCVESRARLPCLEVHDALACGASAHTTLARTGPLHQGQSRDRLRGIDGYRERERERAREREREREEVKTERKTKVKGRQKCKRERERLRVMSDRDKDPTLESMRVCVLRTHMHVHEQGLIE